MYKDEALLFIWIYELRQTTDIYIYIYIEQLVLLQNKRLIIEDVAHEESQQNIFFIEYQLIKYNKECN